MKPSIKAITVSAALIWGGGMLLIGLINLAYPAYGGEFLRMMSSVYPGADTHRTLASVLVGTVYGLIDGAIAGYLFGALYRLFGRQHSPLH